MISSKLNHIFKNALVIAFTSLKCNHTPNFWTIGQSINMGGDRFFTQRNFEKNTIEVRNKGKTVFSTDEMISVLGEQHIKIYGFLGGFVL